MFPITPKASSISITSISPTLVSLTHSLKRQVRRRGGQRWLIDLAYPPLTRAKFAPIWAFSIAQQGQYKTFKYIPEIYGSTSGEAVGTLAVNEPSHTVSTINASNGDFAFHAKLGWLSSGANVKLATYNGVSAFFIPDNGPSIEYLKIPLTLQRLQNLQWDGGSLGGKFALHSNFGKNGGSLILGTTQATSIVNTDGTKAFTQGDKRRLIISLKHNGTHIQYGNITFNGTDRVTVINEQGVAVTNTVPLITPIVFFNINIEIPNGLNHSMFLYIDGVLIANRSFSMSDNASDFIEYTSGSSSGTERKSYVQRFYLNINVLKAGNDTISISTTALNGILKAGDFIKFNNHDKVYMLTSDSTTTKLNIEPALIADVGDSEVITFKDVPFNVAFASDLTNMDVTVNDFVSYSMKLVEVV